MVSKELNLKLLELLPEIKQLYEDEVSWQEGDETGSHTVFADVFFPYILNNLSNKQVTEKNFEVIEEILKLRDEYADEVITVSVLENLFYEKDAIDKFKKFFGTMTSDIFVKFKE